MQSVCTEADQTGAHTSYNTFLLTLATRVGRQLSKLFSSHSYFKLLNGISRTVGLFKVNNEFSLFPTVMRSILTVYRLSTSVVK